MKMDVRYVTRLKGVCLSEDAVKLFMWEAVSVELSWSLVQGPAICGAQRGGAILKRRSTSTQSYVIAIFST
jgi:hypothetical protein